MIAECYLNKKKFKNLLVVNKWKSYQDCMEISVNKINPYRRLGWWEFGNLPFDEHNIPLDEQSREILMKKYYQCTMLYCHNTHIDYNGYFDKRMHRHRNESLISYDYFKNITIDESYNKKVTETLWVSAKVYADDIIITGKFKQYKTDSSVIYYCNELTDYIIFNGCPVKYIYIEAKNKNTNYKTCYKIRFTFDIPTYCNVIDLLLRIHTHKRSLFSLLPKEIIKYILYLTSI